MESKVVELRREKEKRNELKSNLRRFNVLFGCLRRISVRISLWFRIVDDELRRFFELFVATIKNRQKSDDDKLKERRDRREEKTNGEFEVKKLFDDRPTTNVVKRRKIIVDHRLDDQLRILPTVRPSATRMRQRVEMHFLVITSIRQAATVELRLKRIEESQLLRRFFLERTTSDRRSSRHQTQLIKQTDEQQENIRGHD